MRVYLASPFFEQSELPIYWQVVGCLRASGHSVFVPQEHEIPGGWEMTNAEWGKSVFIMDTGAMENCDCVVCLNWGLYSDSGTAWECGYAFAKNIPVVQVLCGEAHQPYSLMMIGGGRSVIPVSELLNGKCKLHDLIDVPTVCGNFEVK